MKLAPALAAALLLAAAPRALADGLEGTIAIGPGWFSHEGKHGHVDDAGAALSLRVDGRVAPRVGLGLQLTWGVMDWDRAAAYVAAGNRAGRWTTDRFADVERWATTKDAREDTRGLRYLGAGVADVFLALSYVAVPACYVASVGGATSYLELDATATLHLSEPSPNDAWVELGLGAAALPAVAEWRGAVGPVLGVGMRLGKVRVGARALVSPPGLNEAPFGGSIVAGTLTVGVTI